MARTLIPVAFTLAWWLVWGPGGSHDRGGVAGPFASWAACEKIRHAYLATLGTFHPPSNIACLPDGST